MKFQLHRLFMVFIVVLLLALPHSELLSQPVLLGLKGGLSIPDLKGGNTPQSEGYVSRLAPTFGVFLNYKLSDHFSLQGEVSYSGQGGKREGMQPIFSENLAGLPVPPDTDLYASFDNTTILNYLEIPVLVCYSFTGNNSGFDVYLDVGPCLSILLNANVNTSGSSRIYLDKDGNLPLEIAGNPLPEQNFDAENDIFDKLNKLNVGITGGIGMDYIFNSQRLRLDLRGVYGFIPIQADEENGKNYTGAFYITLGYGFHI
jgi:hypothetical protein